MDLKLGPSALATHFAMDLKLGPSALATHFGMDLKLGPSALAIHFGMDLKLGPSALALKLLGLRPRWVFALPSGMGRSSDIRPSPPNSSAFGLGGSLLCIPGWVEARAFGPRDSLRDGC